MAKLRSYSSHLADYHRAQVRNSGPLELPGQYTADRPPEPSAHVTIECVSSVISTMSSLRKPKRIKLHGSDQKEYPFLCKGGEDLRLDQRVQLLFGAMNRALTTHAPSCKHGL